jgi:hypothetical protein
VRPACSIRRGVGDLERQPRDTFWVRGFDVAIGMRLQRRWQTCNAAVPTSVVGARAPDKHSTDFEALTFLCNFETI